MVAVASAVAAGLTWRVLGGQVHVLLFAVGLAASCVAGAVSYALLRLRFSSEFKAAASHGLPRSVLRLQEEIVEGVLRRKERLSEAPTAPNITRNIDQAINEIIDLLSRLELKKLRISSSSTDFSCLRS